jgi:hypothetical protein
MRTDPGGKAIGAEYNPITAEIAGNLPFTRCDFVQRPCCAYSAVGAAGGGMLTSTV